jgi:formate hydrogenlyase subunit 3/multisubunit Na+/H+ antiporter MnhD subunit
MKSDYFGQMLVVFILLSPLTAMMIALALRFGVRTSADGAAEEKLLAWSTRLLSALSLLCSVLLYRRFPVDSGLNFAILWVDVYIDALSIYFVFLVNLVAFFASWYVAQFLAHEGKYEAQGSDHNPATFHFFFNAFHLTMLVVPVVDNLVILWMAVELTTVASVLLVRYRGQRRRVEAAWKYILITSAGIVFALFGTIMLADAIGADTCKAIRAAFDTCGDLPPWLLMRWSELARPEVAQTLDGPLVRLAFLLALVGYGAKAGQPRRSAAAGERPPIRRTAEIGSLCHFAFLHHRQSCLSHNRDANTLHLRPAVVFGSLLAAGGHACHPQTHR